MVELYKMKKIGIKLLTIFIIPIAALIVSVQFLFPYVKKAVMFSIRMIFYYWIKKKEEKKRVENKLSRMGIK